MTAVTAQSELLAAKPHLYAVEGHVEFPTTNGNNLTVTQAIAADAAVDWRVEFDRPAAPGAGVTYTWTEAPLYVRMTPTTLQVLIRAADVTFPLATATLTALAAAGFPAVGKRVQVRGEWNNVDDTISLYWRAGGQNVDLNSDDGWTLANVTAAPGKAMGTAVTLWTLGSVTATFLGTGNAYRWIRRVNGVTDIDINGRTDIDGDTATFVATSGQTVTVNRSGTPDTLLVPSVYRGHATGVGDWRFVVELQRGTGFVWGAAKWGTVDPDTGLMPKWGAGGWLDISDRIDGIDTFRGADEPHGRPRIGDITMTVFSDDDEFDPWVNYPHVRPGTLMRAGYVSALDTRAGGWLPKWAGIVDDWPVTYHGVGAMARCNVTLKETLTTLANHDENAVAASGAGETFASRINHLATTAGWPFGMIVDYAAFAASIATMQATTKAGSRLAEMYLTADSAAEAEGAPRRAIVRSDVTGAILVTNDAAHRASRLVEFSSFELFGFDFPAMVFAREPDAYNGDLLTVDYVADSIESANNRDGIVNDHRYARAGGTQQVITHRLSIGRFKERIPRVRGDLICQTDAQALACARADSNTEARCALRVEAIDVELNNDRPDAFLAVAAADIGDLIWLFPPAAVGFDGSGTGRIRSIQELTLPTPEGVEILVTYAIDFYTFSGMPGVQLPPAP